MQIAGTGLWCDATRAQGMCFLSRASEELRGRHRQFLCTQRTLALVRCIDPNRPYEALVTPYGRPFSFGTLRLELFPSGCLPGAASLLVTLERDRRSLVYAGRINPMALPSCEELQIRPAEALLCDAPLADGGRELPTLSEAREALLAALRDAQVNLVLCPALGTAPEVLRLLAGSGRAVHVHPRIVSYLQAYQRLGIAAVPGPHRPLAPRRPAQRGEVVLWPAETRLGPARAGSGADAPRVLVCAGWTLLDDAVARCRKGLGPLGADAVFLPFPDSADLPGLLRYLSQSGARDLYLRAGLSDNVLAACARLRVRVHPLLPPSQLELFSA